MLLDPDSGGLVGVIDWGDMDIGPPHDDLVGLRSWAPDLVEARHPAAMQDVRTMAALYSLEHVRELDAWHGSSLDRSLDRLGKRMARVGR